MITDKRTTSRPPTSVDPTEVFLAAPGAPAPVSHPLDGMVLDGRYELGAMLGRGGMGAVYHAMDLRLGRRVAVKTIRTDLQDHEEILERFTREARVVARLRHPGIVAVHDFGRTSDGVLYLVMELLEGRSLRQELAGATLTPACATAIIRQACDAVAAAHAAGVIHRDLKPDNLFLEPAPAGAPRVKVLDFGVARLQGAAEAHATPFTKPGTLLGTPVYMAPEQCEGKPADERSDVYALGCVLYEALTGRPPFEAGSPLALMHMHLHEEPLPPSKLLEGIPERVEAVALRALRKDPGERFATAEEMATELTRAEIGISNKAPEAER